MSSYLCYQTSYNLINLQICPILPISYLLEGCSQLDGFAEWTNYLMWLFLR